MLKATITKTHTMARRSCQKDNGDDQTAPHGLDEGQHHRKTQGLSERDKRCCHKDYQIT